MAEGTPESSDGGDGSPEERVEQSPTETDAVTDGSAAGDAESIGLPEAQSLGLDYAEQLLSNPVDNIIEVNSDSDGWRVVVEVVERAAVPDTQDILARYEMSVQSDGELSGYSLIDRYQRGDARGGL